MYQAWGTGITLIFLGRLLNAWSVLFFISIWVIAIKFSNLNEFIHTILAHSVNWKRYSVGDDHDEINMSSMTVTAIILSFEIIWVLVWHSTHTMTRRICWQFPSIILKLVAIVHFLSMPLNFGIIFPWARIHERS